MWHSQIDKITQKIASGIGAIERIRPFLPPATLLLHLQCLGTTPLDKLQKVSISGLYGACSNAQFSSQKTRESGSSSWNFVEWPAFPWPRSDDRSSFYVLIYFSKLLLQQKKTITQVWL